MRCCSREQLWGWNGERMEGVGCVCEAFMFGVCGLGCWGVYICNEKILCESLVVTFCCIVFVNINLISGVLIVDCPKTTGYKTAAELQRLQTNYRVGITHQLTDPVY